MIKSRYDISVFYMFLEVFRINKTRIKSGVSILDRLLRDIMIIISCPIIKEVSIMAVRYYWGKPNDVIRWYLRGTLYLSAQSRQRYIEKTGADSGNLPRLLKLLENLDELFDSVDTDSTALLCLRYVELLSIPDTAELTGLSNSQVSTRTAKVMKKAKEIVAKA